MPILPTIIIKFIVFALHQKGGAVGVAAIRVEKIEIFTTWV
jgi:hypothetical protein